MPIDSEDPGRRNCNAKLLPYQRELILQFIDEHYLKLNGEVAAGVHSKISQYIKAKNRSLKDSEKWSTPSYKAVRCAIDRLCPFTVDACRRGLRFAREKWRAIGDGIVTDRINEVWEIDDTRVDVVCLDEWRQSAIGRPWMTVVIDRHSRQLLACLMSFHPPDTFTAMEALRMAMHSKAQLLAGYPSIKGEWLGEGLPTEVHVDNAKIYNSAALKKALESLRIEHKTVPVLKAWYKGTVERVIGTISRQVFHVVPGTTYANIFERDKERPPEEVATATLSELRLKLFKWIVEDYHHRHHKGIDTKTRGG